MSQVPKTYPAVSALKDHLKHMISLGQRPRVTETLHERLWNESGLHSAECQAQVDRMVSNPQLQGSEALSKLLRYLADHTLHSPADHLKEYQIATEVLGRPVDFDPQTDSCVRVQVGRLRTKLADYYNSAGANDTVLVEVPKGGYVLSFKRKVAALPQKASREAVVPPAAAPAPSRSWKVGTLGWALLGISLATSALAIYLVRSRASGASGDQGGAGRSFPALQAFWSPFLNGQQEPFVIFSNASFVGDPMAGMHFYDPTRDSRDQVSEYYTGVGEVMGVLELDRLSHRFGKEIRVKRGGLFTLDDALNNNLIFLGSPVENPSLDKVSTTSQFALRRLPGDKTRWWDIVDLHPPTGSLGVYRSTLRPNSEVDTDFAVVAVVHGLDPSRRTLILEGISTLGTQAAVHYVCDEAAMEDLLRRLNVKGNGPLPFFEALLQIKVANDVPLGISLIDLRNTDH